MYNYIDDNIEEKGYVSKDYILSYLSEEEIFSLVFGVIPKEHVYCKSPLRKDTYPSCFFERHTNGVLFFIDYGSLVIDKNIKRTHLDCFNLVQEYFNIPNFYETLKYIERQLIAGKNLERKIIVLPDNEIKKSAQIIIKTRPFNLKDKNFWSPYEITSRQLEEDRVFAVSEIKVINSKKGDFHKILYDIAYAYTDFPLNRKKIYRPKQIKNKKFVSTCSKNDIGNIRQLVKFGKKLIITKSYKDCRILRNLGLNSVWFQNEGMFPSYEILYNLALRFEKVIVFYDNDKTGIESSNKLVEIINVLIPNKAESVYLPIELLEENIKDASDLFVKKSKQHLIEFLISVNITL